MAAYTIVSSAGTCVCCGDGGCMSECTVDWDAAVSSYGEAVDSPEWYGPPGGTHTEADTYWLFNIPSMRVYNQVRKGRYTDLDYYENVGGEAVAVGGFDCDRYTTVDTQLVAGDACGTSLVAATALVGCYQNESAGGGGWQNLGRRETRIKGWGQNTRGLDPNGVDYSGAANLVAHYAVDVTDNPILTAGTDGTEWFLFRNCLLSGFEMPLFGESAWPGYYTYGDFLTAPWLQVVTDGVPLDPALFNPTWTLIDLYDPFGTGVADTGASVKFGFVPFAGTLSLTAYTNHRNSYDIADPAGPAVLGGTVYFAPSFGKPPYTFEVLTPLTGVDEAVYLSTDPSPYWCYVYLVRQTAAGSAVLTVKVTDADGNIATASHTTVYLDPELGEECTYGDSPGTRLLVYDQSGSPFVAVVKTTGTPPFEIITYVDPCTDEPVGNYLDACLGGLAATFGTGTVCVDREKYFENEATVPTSDFNPVPRIPLAGYMNFGVAATPSGGGPCPSQSFPSPGYYVIRQWCSGYPVYECVYFSTTPAADPGCSEFELIAGPYGSTVQCGPCPDV